MKDKTLLQKAKNLKLEYILLVALGTVIIAIIVFLLINNFKANQNNSNIQKEDPFAIDREYLSFDQPNLLYFGNTVIKLPESWVIKSFFKNPTKGEFTCINKPAEEDCVVYEITDGSNSFYVSTPTSYRKFNQSGANAASEKITFLSAELQLIIEQSDIVSYSEDGSSSQVLEDKFIQQAYVCGKEGICMSTGFMPYEIENNKNNYKVFKQLVSALNLADQ